MAKGGLCRRRCHGNGLLAGTAGSTPWLGVALTCLRAYMHLCVRAHECHWDVKSRLVFVTSLSLLWQAVREPLSVSQDSLSPLHQRLVALRSEHSTSHQFSATAPRAALVLSCLFVWVLLNTWDRSQHKTETNFTFIKESDLIQVQPWCLLTLTP